FDESLCRGSPGSNWPDCELFCGCNDFGNLGAAKSCTRETYRLAEYMTTQKIYAGWSFFCVAIIAAIVFTLTHALMVRAERAAFLLSLTALLCLGATQLIFWTFNVGPTGGLLSQNEQCFFTVANCTY